MCTKIKARALPDAIPTEDIIALLTTIALSDVFIMDIMALLNAKIVAGATDVDEEAIDISQNQAVENVHYGDDVSEDGECNEVDDICAVYDVEWSIDARESANTQEIQQKQFK